METNQKRKVFRINSGLLLALVIVGLGLTSSTLASAKVSRDVEQQSAKITASGVIVDAEGLSVIGASVVEKGNETNGVVADADGKFTISVNRGATLVVSCIGYADAEVAAGQNLRVVLSEDTEMLEDVVVVGYGVQRKETLTGAVTAITSEDITTTKSENFINSLQGKMPGLLIRQKTGEPGVFDNMVSIRGYGDPLVVIDGITRNGTSDLSQLNAEDIESVSILKDASAAIYGMNAANGVIIVTTKQGKNEKARFTYSNELGTQTPTGFERTADAYTYYYLQNEMNRNEGKAETYTQEFLNKYKNGEPGYVDHDWLSMYMKDWTFKQNHNISVRGGSDKVRYFTSFGYNEDNGMLSSGVQYFKRYNLRSNLSVDLTRNLKMNFNLSGRWSEQGQPREAFVWNYKTLLVNERGVGPYALDENGNEVEGHWSYIQPEGKNAGALTSEVDGYIKNRTIGYNTSMEFVYTAPWLKGLSISALASYDGSYNNNQTVQKTYQLYDYYTNEKKNVFGSNSISVSMGAYQKIYGRIQANYSKRFGNHSIGATLAAEASETRNDSLSGGRQYTDLFTTDILDQASSSTASNGGNRSFGRLAAYLGRINYDFKGKYLFEAVGRYDGSYRYAPAYRWAFFPSVSAGWRISEEPFIKENIPALNNLKLRVSYGQSGRDQGSAWAYIGAYSSSNSAGYTFDGSSLTVGMTAPGVISESMTWITSTIENIGLDFELWRGKLGGSIEAFQRINTGELTNPLRQVPNTFGASFPQENLNSSKNFGTELSLYHTNQVNRDFHYTVSANFTYARSMNLHREQNPYETQYSNWQSNSVNRYTGRAWFYDDNNEAQFTSLEEYETAPLYGGTLGNSMMLPGSYIITDLNGDGIINSSDQRLQRWSRGSNPPIQYGLTISAGYKNWDLSMVWQGASGYYIQYSNNDIWGYGRYPTIYQKYLDRWHTLNDTDDPFNPATKWVSGTYPALKSYGHKGTMDMGSGGTGNMMINMWNPDATYLRLKSLEIGYTLPRNITKSINISSARIYFNAFNLLTICQKMLKKADPEREERDYSAGLAYPLMRSYNVGVNISF